MRVLAALLAVATAGLASESRADSQWALGLESALTLAGQKDRLILLRQVHCSCDESACRLLDLARRPGYLRLSSTQERVEKSFILAVAHAPANGEARGLHHPGFIPAEFRRNPSQIQTLFVTPTGHVIHRLDLCPQADDVDGELAFALRIREVCFTSTWAPVPGWEERLRSLHAEHAFKHELWHKSKAAAKSASPESGPGKWSGYARLDLAWQPDLEGALKLASGTSRLVFYFQVVGNLDLEGC